ncbi:MAG TPA: hypothetical protein VKX35_00465 [Fermentimonas sp.]|nr:hypothetical protein [Fermentimonas sp.]
MKDFLFRLSGMLILLSVAFYMFLPDLAPWIMSVSVLIFSAITISNPYPGKSVRGKRLFNFQVFSCLLMIAATYLMFKQRNEWVLLMIAAAIFMLYAVIAIPKELDKEKNIN